MLSYLGYLTKPTVKTSICTKFNGFEIYKDNSALILTIKAWSKCDSAFAVSLTSLPTLQTPGSAQHRQTINIIRKLFLQGIWLDRLRFSSAMWPCVIYDNSFKYAILGSKWNMCNTIIYQTKNKTKMMQIHRCTKNQVNGSSQALGNKLNNDVVS